jgi:hypothetical protein
LPRQPYAGSYRPLPISQPHIAAANGERQHRAGALQTKNHQITMATSSIAASGPGLEVATPVRSERERQRPHSRTRLKLSIATAAGCLLLSLARQDEFFVTRGPLNATNPKIL